MRQILAALFIVACLWPTLALSQGNGDAMRAVPVPAGERLVLDGTLNHPAWKRAPAHDSFVERDPNFGAAPPQATRVQVLFDEQALWIGITAFEREPAQMRKRIVRRDEVNRTQDFVVAYVDAIGQRSSAQFFRVNAAGSLADGLHTNADDSEDFAPDFDWDAAVSHHEQGWTAVLRLPFASLRFAEPEGAVQKPWRIMVARRLPRAQFHLVTSVPIPRDSASFIATMQPLDGVALPEKHAFLTIRPSVTGTRSQQGGERRDKFDSSLDVKWRPRAELVIDGTLNPDFSQVELDVPQLAGNSRFALFVTEKRPFFFESADLLRAPISNSLYTRSFTEPRGGLRATWRDSGFAGTAFAIDDRGGGLVLLPAPYGTGAAEQPGSRALALRGRHQGETIGPLRSLQLGGIAVARHYENGRGANTVLGPDLGATLPGDWLLRGQWLHSRTTARPDAQGELARGAAADGDRVYLRLRREDDTREQTFWFDDISDDFRHDSGFVNQVGIRRLGMYQAKGWRKVGPLNAFYVNVEIEQVRARSDGAVIEERVRPGLWLNGANNLEAWVEYYGHSRKRVAAGTPLLEENFVAAGLTMTPARWLPLLNVSGSFGKLVDAEAVAVRPGLQWTMSARTRLLPSLEIEPRLDQAWLKRDGQRTYRESAIRWLAIWHLDARQNLRLISQRQSLLRLAEPGVDAADGLSRTTSLTYSWRIGTGTQLYLGATRSRPDRGAEPRSEAFVKMQFDVDEARAVLR
jgi:hypothetical protein